MQFFHSFLPHERRKRRTYERRKGVGSLLSCIKGIVYEGNSIMRIYEDDGVLDRVQGMKENRQWMQSLFLAFCF